MWYYILAEAQQQFFDDSSPIRLGPVAGRILGEVLVGLMFNNPNSYLREEPFFRPHEKLCSSAGVFGMADLLSQAMLV